MPGIYIHIPFCRKACHYCDFHFSTSLKYMDEMVDAICKELVLKKSRLNGTVGTVYFGGGTPSLLPEYALQRIFDTLIRNFDIAAEAEITMEANPDDLTAANIRMFRSVPVNRFSIGVQSFFDEDLRWMNRAHTAGEAEDCIKRSQDAGFENLTIDLIYGYPLLTDEKWLHNIHRAVALDIPHLSSYALTVEDRTALATSIRKGWQAPVSDEQGAEQLLTLIKELRQAGYEHYEISNFAKPGRYAVHNTNYWRGVPYLGIGPSAHGYDGNQRFHNVANNAKYMAKLETGQLAETVEVLSAADKFNEYIMTALRTMWGVDLEKIKIEFPDFYAITLRECANFMTDGKLILKNNTLTLSENGKLYADRIASELFILNDD